MKLGRSTHAFLRLVVAGALAACVVPAPVAANTMQPSTPYATGAWPKGVAVGDVNDDGRNDIVTANYQGGSFTIYLQQATGALGAPITKTIRPLANAASVQIVDVTGDGDNDIVIGDTFYQSLHVYRYQGGTTWRWLYAMQVDRSAGGPYSSPFDFGYGDATMDGTIDLVVPLFYQVPVFSDGNKMLESDYGAIKLLTKQPVYVGADFTAVDSSGDSVVVPSLQGLLRISSNGGQDWIDAYPPAVAARGISDVSFSDYNTAWAVGNGFILSTNNQGFSWSVSRDDLDGRLNAISTPDEYFALAVGDAGLVSFIKDQAYDEYADWTDYYVPDSIRAVYEGDLPDLYDVESLAGGQGFAVGENGAVWRFRALGSSMNATMSVMTTPTGDPNLYGVASAGTVLCAVGEGGAIFLSSNAVTATALSPAIWSDESSAGADLNDVTFLDDLVGWAVGDGGRVLNTTDGGVTWTETAEGTDDLQSIHFASASEGWIVGDDSTILYTDDGGATWTPQTSFLGGWGQKTTYYESTFNPFSAVIGDMNGDLKNDIGAAGYLGGTFMPQYLTGWNHPWATYFNAPSLANVSMGAKPHDVVLGDVNDDGLNDVAGVDYQNDKLSVSLQNSIHMLVNPESDFVLDTGMAPVSLDIGDVTGDGLNDIVVANSYNSGIDYEPKGSIGIFVQNSLGKLDPMREIFLGNQPYGVKIGNVDGDSAKEIIVTNSGDNSLQVLNYGSPLPPTVTSTSHPRETTYYRTTTAQFALAAPADFDGIEGFHYVIDRSASTVPTRGSDYTTSRSLSLNLAKIAAERGESVQGYWYFHAVSRDVQGRVGTRADHYGVKIDTLPPSKPVPNDNVGGWTTSRDRTFTWAASSDSRSGFSRYWVSVNGGKETSTTVTKFVVENLKDGASKFSVRAVDKAGNTSARGEHVAYVDVGAPTVAVTRPASNGLWLSGYYLFAATARDAAGVSSVEFKVDGKRQLLDTAAPYELKLNTANLANGAHTLDVVAKDMYGRAVSARKTFNTDKTKPVLSYISDYPDPFYPVIKEGYKDTTKISYRLSESATVKLEVFDSAGALWRSFAYAKNAGANAYYWDGKSNDGRTKTGTFSYRLTAVDRAGNAVTSSKYPVTIRDYEVVRISASQVKVIPR